MPKISLVVFDLSGTTVSDYNAVAKSLYEAALEFDLKVDLPDFEKTIGNNKIHLYQFMIAKSRGEPEPTTEVMGCFEGSLPRINP